MDKENKDLLIKLAELEKNLQEVDSASQMVNKTANAYKDICGKIDNYASTLQKTTNSLSGISQSLQALHETIDKGVGKDLTSKFGEMENGLSSLQNTTTSIRDTFHAQCDSNTSNLKKSLSGIQSDFSQHCKDVQAEISKANNPAIDELNNSSSQLKNTLENCQTTVDSIADKINTEIKLLKKELTTLKEEQNKSQEKIIKTVSFNQILSVISIIFSFFLLIIGIFILMQ